MFDSLLTGKIMGGLSLVLLIAFAAFGVYHYILVASLEHTITKQNDKISELSTRNAELESINTTLTAANTKMAASIDTQNAKIEETIKAQKDATAAAQKRADAATASAAQMKDRYYKILNAPRITADDCEELKSKVSEYLAMRHADSAPDKPTETNPPEGVPK